MVESLEWTWPTPPPPEPEPGPEVISIHDIDPFGSYATSPPEVFGSWTGDKFYGGFGETTSWAWDYWTLRQRSAQLFKENIYAKGLIGRLITNVINTGLTVEVRPEESIIGVPEESLDDWSETVENRFGIWANTPALCDYRQQSTYGEIQQEIRREALIEGDILVVLRLSPKTKLPQIELVPGSKIQDPGTDGKSRPGNEIKYGVEINPAGKHVAFWTRDKEGNPKRITAVGEKSGRRVAWLVYGTPKRVEDVRGEPMLSAYLQSLKEVDRYRDAAQRKANLNANIAGFIEKTADKPGTKPMSGGAGAVRKQTAVTTDGDGTTRTFPITAQIPGLWLQELQTGEKPTVHASGADVNLGPFEEVVIAAVAWSAEIPPEILRLAFSSNYAASQGAVSEFKMYLNRERARIGSRECKPVYNEWFLSEILLGKIVAPGFLQSRTDPMQYDVHAAWLVTDWAGAIKPAGDLGKQVKAYGEMQDRGYITGARASRELTGTKLSKNLKIIRRENELLVAAREPLAAAAAAAVPEPEVPDEPEEIEEEEVTKLEVVDG